MAQIRIDLAETLVDGMDIKFKAPCACNEITGLIVYYPAEDETIQAKELFFRDAHGNDLTGMGNLFSKDAYVKVIADVGNGFAYIQNADNNGFLNSAIFGTYIHDAENLIGSGENGKFKATVSGTISSINVNGVSCSVKCGEDTSMDLIAGCWYTFILDGTTVNFSSGGAGAGLNFKVVGGTTEPVSPSENMIWVNTEVAISSYMFAAVEPTSPAEGMVWISVGISSTVAFNALKKNGIQVYPIAAKQYVDGAWVSVPAKSYQNGEWVNWATYLYDSGDRCTDITGGWISEGMTYASNNECTPATASISDSNNQMVITMEKNWRTGVVWTAKTVDLTRFKTIEIAGYDNGTYDDEFACLIVIPSDASTYWHQSAICKANLPNTAGEKVSLDISEISGSYRVGIGMLSTSSSITVIIDKIELR